MSTALQFQAAQIRLERVACPRCGSLHSSPLFSAQDYIYGLPGVFYAERCNDCGLWFQNPRPSDADLPLLYPETYAPHAETAPELISSNKIGPRRRLTAPLRRIHWLRNFWRGWNHGFLTLRLRYQHVTPQSAAERFGAVMGSSLSRAARQRAGCDLIPRFVPGGRVLELGCGNGNTLKRLRELRWRNLHGVELSEAAARIARQAGFTVTTAAVETALESYPDASFDAIVASMLLEHLTNPFAVVRQVARKLKPGGEFVFSTVIRDSLDGRIFGRYGVCYDFPRHMVFFRKRELDDMLRSDFERIQSWRQNTPIDFQRPARLRHARFDAQLCKFFESRAGAQVVSLLARLNLMGRISYRCRRKL